MARAPAILPVGIRGALPSPLKSLAKAAICRGVDLRDRLRGGPLAPTPPCELRVRVGCFFDFIDASHFHAVGDEFRHHLIDLVGLTPRSRLLDVGCGCGQVATRLLDFLTEPGSCYAGFDPDLEAITWCRAHLSSRNPAFAFEHADLDNGFYNRGGGIAAEAWRFPYPDARFDAILVKSVFTHMRRPEVEAYLGEMQRVLAPGGRVLLTTYLLNEESRQAISDGKGAFSFSHPAGGGHTEDPDRPEYSMAFDETVLRSLVDGAGLVWLEPAHIGTWYGRDPARSFQDLVVLEAPGSG